MARRQGLGCVSLTRVTLRYVHPPPANADENGSGLTRPTRGDYINRAMPLYAPGSLQPDEADHHLVAFRLWRNNPCIIGTATMHARTIRRWVPAHDRFVRDNPRRGPGIL